jgi:hypothetical protein
MAIPSDGHLLHVSPGPRGDGSQVGDEGTSVGDDPEAEFKNGSMK